MLERTPLPPSRRAGGGAPAAPARTPPLPVKGWPGGLCPCGGPSPEATGDPNEPRIEFPWPDQRPWHARRRPGSRPDQARPACSLAPGASPPPSQPRLFKEGRGCAALRLAGPDLLGSQQGRGHIFHAARHAGLKPAVRTSCQQLHSALGRRLRPVMSPRPAQYKYQSNPKRKCTNSLKAGRHDFSGEPVPEPCMRSYGAGPPRHGSGRAAKRPVRVCSPGSWRNLFFSGQPKPACPWIACA